MSGANVEDLEIFRSLKAALVKFRQTAETAIMNSDSQTMRTLSWLENEQISYWTSQIRKRQEAVSRAADAVRGKKLFKDAAGRTPDASREEKMLKMAQAALIEAEMRLGNTKRSIPRLQKEIESYRGGVQGLGNAMVSDIPRAIAMIERMASTLDEYTAAQAGGVQSDGFYQPAGETGASPAAPAEESAEPQAPTPKKAEGDDVTA